MTLPIIQSLWIGNSLTQIEQVALSSFLKNGHHFHLYVYQDVANVPDGVILKDANKIIKEKEIFTYKESGWGNGSYAGFADWFRWELLSQKGDFYVDTDIVCLKPFDFTETQIFGMQDNSDLSVCPAVIKFPARSKICRYLAKKCYNPGFSTAAELIKMTLSPKKRTFKERKNHLLKAIKSMKNVLSLSKRESRALILWGEAGGPKGFTKALKKFKLLDLTKSVHYFYPVHYNNFKTIFDETFANKIKLLEKSYAIHLWNEFIRKNKKINKNQKFPEKSLFGQLKSKYLN